MSPERMGTPLLPEFGLSSPSLPTRIDRWALIARHRNLGGVGRVTVGVTMAPCPMIVC